MADVGLYDTRMAVRAHGYRPPGGASRVGRLPFGGFVGKLTLCTATIEGGDALLAALAIANTVVSLYYLRIIGPMYLEHTSAERPTALGRTTDAGAGLPTVAVVAVGVLAEPCSPHSTASDSSPEQWAPRRPSLTLRTVPTRVLLRVCPPRPLTFIAADFEGRPLDYYVCRTNGKDR